MRLKTLEVITMWIFLLSGSTAVGAYEANSTGRAIIALIIFFASLVVLFLEVDADEELKKSNYNNYHNDASYPAFFRK